MAAGDLCIRGNNVMTSPGRRHDLWVYPLSSLLLSADFLLSLLLIFREGRRNCRSAGRRYDIRHHFRRRTEVPPRRDYDVSSTLLSLMSFSLLNVET